MKALIIDDEVDICYLLGGLLLNKNMHTDYANTIAEARLALEKNYPEIIFLDNHLPDGKGIVEALGAVSRYTSLPALFAPLLCRTVARVVANGGNTEISGTLIHPCFPIQEVLWRATRRARFLRLVTCARPQAGISILAVPVGTVIPQAPSAWAGCVRGPCFRLPTPSAGFTLRSHVPDAT